MSYLAQNRCSDSFIGVVAVLVIADEIGELRESYFQP